MKEPPISQVISQWQFTGKLTRRIAVSGRLFAATVFSALSIVYLDGGSHVLASGPAATSEPAPVPLVSRRLSLWGLYGYSAPPPAAGGAQSGTEPAAATAVPQPSPTPASPTAGQRTQQAASSGGLTDDWFFTLGLGIAAAPDYEGSEDYEPVPLLFLDAERNDNLSIKIRGTRVRANLVPDSVFRAGPVLEYRFKRGNVENDQVDDLQSVDGTVELGAFVGVEVPLTGDNAWGATFEGLQGTGGGHSGFLANLELFYKTRFGESWNLRLGADSTWASEDYMDAYFGIDGADSARSGLDTFDADADIKDASLSLRLNYQISGGWGAGLITRYTRLLGDAEDSPVVDDVGDANQFFSGLFGYYTF